MPVAKKAAASAAAVKPNKANKAILETTYAAAPLAGLTSDGEKVCTKMHAGKWLVVYFYPKDMTPGCTTESRDFQSLARAFEKEGALVFGVSKDSCESHRKFVTKEGLHDFRLISDESGALCDAFGVWKEKKNYGKTYMGIERSTFLVDPHGQVRARWEKVRVDGHAQAVLDTLRALKTA